MDNAGSWPLAPAGETEFEITIAGTVTSAELDISGASSATISARMAYGADGESVSVEVQTTLNGASWIPIARMTFATATQEKVVNLTTTTPIVEAPYEVLAIDDDTAVDGILGNALRAVVETTGTYTGSTLVQVRAAVR